ncbi:hypothetical protein BDZ88DRAFT_434773 [Geranomyces variabilis]|nr:hypothetical protein BDZ88DRAFT_434773 [Geranomyces variabilis]
MWSTSLPAVAIAVTTILLITVASTTKWVIDDWGPPGYGLDYGLLRECFIQPWLTNCHSANGIWGAEYENFRTTAAAMLVFAIIANAVALCKSS